MHNYTDASYTRTHCSYSYTCTYLHSFLDIKRSYIFEQIAICLVCVAHNLNVSSLFSILTAI